MIPTRFIGWILNVEFIRRVCSNMTDGMQYAFDPSTKEIIYSITYAACGMLSVLRWAESL